MQALIEHLWAAEAHRPTPSVDAWWARHRALALELPFDRAVAGGLAADRLGWAFASGYQAAGCALFGGGERLTALCATEDGKAHPATIRTRLAAGRLSGRKSFVTFGTHAGQLAIVASEGVGPDGRNRLRVVRIGAARAGVTVQAHPPTPFAPEIPHAQLTLDDVRVAPEEVLPGDGYTAYLKPFRTVEDVHVHGALLGYLLGLGRAGAWSTDPVLAAILGLRQLALADPGAPATHVGLGALIAETRALADGLDWARAPTDAAARWRRDRPLLDIAGAARARRLAVAHERLSAPAPG